MLSYYLKCKKNTESEKSKSLKNKKRKNNVYIKLCGLWQ